jgi:Asp-tRNA(Asn)/Glu-tRNA(Gln) amidotransferase A subunit family amidase
MVSVLICPALSFTATKVCATVRVGMQMTGRLFDEALLFRMGAAY